MLGDLPLTCARALLRNAGIITAKKIASTNPDREFRRGRPLA
jgi:hypothetical protein